MTAENPQPYIRTAPHPDCLLCGAGGQLLYTDQQDRLFGAWGSWNLKKCCNQACGLIWLDPMPVAEDLGKAYLSYYTHAAPPGTSPGPARRLFRLMKRSYLAQKYHYHNGDPSFQARLLGSLMYLLPISRGGADADARYLHQVPNGRLLDVGCGAGRWLLFMRELGWEVEGTDFDDNAVAVARRSGLNVRCGLLDKQNYANAAFDAVTLNHVIEHIPDPVGTLAECARILKPGGKLIVATPNASSLGHRFFKHNWRGLEPPRHLQIFSPDSLRQCLRLAGFQSVSIHPQIATSVTYQSALLRKGGCVTWPPVRRCWSAWMIAWFVNLVELCAPKRNPMVGDCMAAVAAKV